MRMTPGVWYLYASAAYLFDHLENKDAIEESAGLLANSDVQGCVAWMNSKPGPNCGQVSSHPSTAHLRFKRTA